MPLYDGLIPAHAGKTAATARAAPSSEAHPRSRGENSSFSTRNVSHGGSSPLTRGKQTRRNFLDCRVGLIPAHAGKTTPSEWPPPSAWAHPRSRGENSAFNELAPVLGGSSPLTRGKQGRCGVGVISAGLIPAHAGKTSTKVKTATIETAHPRSRGENPIGVALGALAGGSSPLTRGKLW